jgi:leucyl-tRNA synthetase
MNPFVPHLAEELWNSLGQTNELSFVKWPIVDNKYLISDEISIAIQINGKRRSEILIPINISKDEVLIRVKSNKIIIPYLLNVTIIKEIYVEGRIVNIVVK